LTIEELRVVISAKTEKLQEGIRKATSRLDGFRKTSDDTSSAMGGSIKSMQKKLESLNSSFEKTQAKIKETQDKISELGMKQEKIMEGYRDFPAFTGMTKDESLKQIFTADPNIQKIQKEIDKLQATLNPLISKNKQVNEEITRLGNTIKEAGSKTEHADGKFKGLRDRLDQVKDRFRNTGRSAERSTGKIAGFATMLDRSFRRVLRRIFIYNLIYKAIRGFIGYVGGALKTNNDFVRSLNTIKTNLRVAFQPIYDFVLPAIQALMNGLATLTSYIASFTSALFGKTYKQSYDAAKGIETAKKQMDGYGGAAKKAGKEAQGALMGFDEINQLDIQEPDSDGGAGNFEMEMPDLTTIDISIFDKIKERFNELKELFKEGFIIGVGGWDEFEKANQQIRENITGIKENLKDIFNDKEVRASIRDYQNAVAMSLGEIAGSVVSIGQTIAVNFTGGFNKYLEQSKGFIKERIVSIFDVRAEIAEIVGNLSVAIADILSVFRGETAQQITADIIGIFSNAFLGVADLAGKLGRDILDLISAPIIKNKYKIKDAIENTLKPIATITNSIKNVVTSAFTEIHKVYDAKIHSMFKTIKEGISDTFGKLLDTYNAHIAPVLDRLANKASEVFEQHLQPLLSEVIGLVGDLAECIGAFFENVLKPAIDWIIANILPVLVPILEGIGLLVLNVFEVVIDVIKGIVEVLRGVIQFLAGVFSGDLDKALEGIGKIFEGLVKIVETIVNKVVEFFEWLYNILVGRSIIPDMVNAIVEWFGSLFTKVTEKVKELVDAVIKFFTDLWDGIKQKTEDAWNSIKTFLVDTIWNPIKTSAQTIWEGIKNFILNPIQSAQAQLTTIWSNIKTFTLGKWDEMRQGISSMKNALVDAIMSPFKIADKQIHSVIGSAKSWGRNLIQNFVDGINAMIGKVKSAVQGVANTVSGFIGFSSPTKEGPGRDADKWMPNMMDMLVEGIESNIYKIEDSANMAAQTLRGIGNPNNADSIASAIAGAISGNTSGDTTIIVKIGDDTITEKVISNINRKSRISGKTVLQV
jgi:phage-related protein